MNSLFLIFALLWITEEEKRHGIILNEGHGPRDVEYLLVVTMGHGDKYPPASHPLSSLLPSPLSGLGLLAWPPSPCWWCRLVSIH